MEKGVGKQVEGAKTKEKTSVRVNEEEETENKES